MNCLIDTQIILWSLSDNSQLSNQVLEIIADFNNNIYFCQISLIEIAIKLKIGKLKLDVDLSTIIRKLLHDGYDQINVKNKHIIAYQRIPLFDNHRDPFDRLIIATALSEKLRIITADEKFVQYKDLISLIEV